MALAAPGAPIQPFPSGSLRTPLTAIQAALGACVGWVGADISVINLQMFIEQNKLKRQSQLLLQSSLPDQQLLKALDENSKLIQQLEEERIQHQQKVTDFTLERGTYTRADTHMYTHMHVHINTHTHMFTQTHHTHIRTHNHTLKQVLVRLSRIPYFSFFTKF